MLQDKYSTTLLKELTSWAVVSVTFNFLAAHFHATLCGLLGDAVLTVYFGTPNMFITL
jgi:hypothetical protein